MFKLVAVFQSVIQFVICVSFVNQVVVISKLKVSQNWVIFLYFIGFACALFYLIRLIIHDNCKQSLLG